MAPSSTSSAQPAPPKNTVYIMLQRAPIWLIVAMLLSVVFVWQVRYDETYITIFRAVGQGLWTTLWVTIVAFFGATVFGLFIGLARLSSSRLLRELATLYVEVVRGIPMLVLLLYVAFVVAPATVAAINWLGDLLGPAGQGMAEFRTRDFDNVWRAIMALVIGYSAFISEIFRAGIESIERGQFEAAKSLGMNPWQVMRLVILPQAVRRVLPPLANDFIAMLKDSSLVSVLGVKDITRIGDSYAVNTFKYFESYNVVAFFYLTMTLILSLLVRRLEQRMPQNK
jgi:His/Glu/Gln/Arg/opine family amino acid ABC transporter permease subunit